MHRIPLALLLIAIPAALPAQGLPDAVQPSFQARFLFSDSVPEVRNDSGRVESGLELSDDLSPTSQFSREYVVGVPTGDGNRLVFSFFSTSSKGGGRIDQTFEFFGQTFDINSALEAQYNIRNFRASWDLLSWPAGAKESDRFRFKTLWELQYLRVSGEVSTLDLENPIRISQSRSLLLPTFGVGFDWRARRDLDCNTRLSGFGLGSRGRVWNGEALCAWRVRGVHAVFGLRQFGASTGRASDQYFNIRFGGPTFGIERRF
jgi:hypothetical protein